MAQGGYREPSNPAPVSGPGALSKRTDGGQPVRDPGGLPYGDNAELRSTQGAAPMAGQSPEAAAASPKIPLAQMSPDLYAKSDFPDEPLTSGVPFGPGAGPEALARNQAGGGPTQERLSAYMPAYIQMAESPYTSPEFKTVVYYLRSVLGG